MQQADMIIQQKEVEQELVVVEYTQKTNQES